MCQQHVKHRASVFVLLLMLGVSSGDNSATAHHPASVTSFRTLRYESVVAQTEWWTCGPAALATLLTFFYDIPTSEDDMLTPAVQAMEAAGKDPEKGITLYALSEALSQAGVPSKGYQLGMDGLESYFRRGGLPLIVHVTMPKAHYLVGVGVVSGQLIAADPSFGMRTLDLESLYDSKGFEGIVLVPVPPEPLIAPAANNQPRVLRHYELRLARLHALGGQL